MAFLSKAFSPSSNFFWYYAIISTFIRVRKCFPQWHLFIQNISACQKHAWSSGSLSVAGQFYIVSPNSQLSGSIFALNSSETQNRIKWGRCFPDHFAGSFCQMRITYQKCYLTSHQRHFLLYYIFGFMFRILQNHRSTHQRVLVHSNKIMTIQWCFSIYNWNLKIDGIL